MPQTIGYARVSTTDQDCSIQEETLKAAGATTVRSERKSGTTTAGRTELATVLDFLREGDTLLVTRIDRLARSLGDLEGIVREPQGQGRTPQGHRAGHRHLHPCGPRLPPDAGGVCRVRNRHPPGAPAGGNCQGEGQGVYKGRKASVPVAEVQRLKAEGLGASVIAKQLGIARSSVYEALKAG